MAEWARSSDYPYSNETRRDLLARSPKMSFRFATEDYNVSLHLSFSGDDSKSKHARRTNSPRKQMMLLTVAEVCSIPYSNVEGSKQTHSLAYVYMYIYIGSSFLCSGGVFTKEIWLTDPPPTFPSAQFHQAGASSLFHLFHLQRSDP
jgi:hypothetical protein